MPKILKVKGVAEIVVVDDGSTDRSLEILERLRIKSGEFKVIKQEKNYGFSTSCNVGVKHSAGDVIFLLNTDAVPEENCLAEVLNHFHDPEVFSISANVGGSWSWAKFERGYFQHYMAGDKSNQLHQTLWSSGGSGLFRKTIWNKLGGLDELFNRFYEEDIDLGYRATKRGYINLWDPSFKVEHYREKGVIAENFSKDYVARIAQRNQLFFIWKNLTSQKLIIEHQKALVKMLLSHPKYWMVFLSALIHLPEILRKREIEKAQAKLIDEEILGRFG